MKVENYKVITDGAMTGTDTINSDPIWLGHICNWAIQLVWVKSSGTLDGDYKIQVSNAALAAAPSSGKVVPLNVVWTDLDSATGSVTDGDGNDLINFENAGYQWARIVYINTTGVGVLQARINGKGF